MKLSELQIGSTATILSVGGSGALRQHFLDMGLIQGTEKKQAGKASSRIWRGRKVS